MRWRTSDSGPHRDWLVFDGTSQTMFCALCRKHASDGHRSNSFVSGTQNLKLEAVKGHESSKSHLHVMKIAKGISAPETTTAMRTLVSLKTAQLDRRLYYFEMHTQLPKREGHFKTSNGTARKLIFYFLLGLMQ